MEESKKPRRKFDEQFRRDAVRLMTDGGRTMSQVSRDLGVGLTQLRRWKERFGEKPEGGTRAPDSAESVEFEKVRRELALVKEEREILKKALAVFSRRPG